jgi:hypothetical protein
MVRIVALSLFCLAFFANSANARTIVTEVQYYREIVVQFSENAHICGLKDEAPIREAVAKRLSGMDLPQNPDAKIAVLVGITATAAGAMKQRCVANIEIQFLTMMESTFLNKNVYQGDETWSMISQRNYKFPAILFKTNAVFLELQPSVPERTLEVIEILMDNVQKARSLK